MFNESDDPADAPEPAADPARVAAAIILSRALEAAGTTRQDAGRDGAVCLVRLPDPAWADLIRSEWKVTIRGGAEYHEGVDRWRRPPARWVCWMPDEAPRPAAIRDAAEQFALAVSEGRHCIGIAADVSWLPPDLVLAADVALTVPPLTGADITKLVRAICGRSSRIKLAEASAARLTPRLLRLARRPGQTADDYVRKLVAILERDAAPARAEPRAIGPVLDDLPGMDGAVAWGRDLARDLRGYRTGSLQWADVDRGALLFGPPGVGKTTFARALATSCGVPLTLGSLGQWQAAGHLGDLLKAMRATFAAALKSAPAILFIDEIDGFGDRASFSGENRDYSTQVVNALLELLDGASVREGLVVVGACNDPGRLDPAILRSGRLDRTIEIPMPDLAALQRILRFHLAADLGDTDLSTVAMACVGLTGADCERLVRGARRRARGAGRPMALADLAAEIAPPPRSAEDDLRTAYHEAGHALAMTLIGPGEVVCATIRTAAGGMAGGVMSEVERQGSSTAEELEVRLQVLLAGRAAEEVALGSPSDGAGGGLASDLARATALATAMETALGLGAGLLWTASPDTATSVLALRPDVARRVSERLDAAYEAVTAMLRRERAALDALATALVTRGMLSGADVRSIIEACR